MSLGSYIALTTMSTIQGLVFGVPVQAAMFTFGCSDALYAPKDTPVSSEELSHVVRSSGQGLGFAKSIVASVNAIEQSYASFRDTTVFLS